MRVVIVLNVCVIAVFLAYRRMISPKKTWWKIEDTSAAKKRVNVPKWIRNLFQLNNPSVPKIVVFRISFSFFVLLNGPILSFFWVRYPKFFFFAFCIAVTIICWENILHIFIYYWLKRK